MNDREPIDGTAWAAWVEYVVATLGVDTPGVSPRAVRDLTGQIATYYQRPMAPVSAYLWGLTIATHPDRDPGELAQAILGALPED